MTHQTQAFAKLKDLKVGALYMDMGTGKTRTMIEIIKYKIDKGKPIDKVIWFCPCSAKENIRHEFVKHMDNWEDIFLLVGIESMSSSIKLNSYLFNLVKAKKCLIVVDESTKIKNFKAIRSQRIVRLGEFCEYRFILTGMPVPRDELDLFGQWYFLDWRILGYKSQWSFMRNHAVYHEEFYNKIIDTKNTEYLSKRTAPYTFQIRIDECVDLPKKYYDKRYFSLCREQLEMYIELANALLFEVNEWIPETIYRLFNVLQSICSGYDYTVSVSHEIEKKGFRSSRKDNPRLDAFLDLVEGIKGKVIIFCEYTDEILAILKYLNDIYGKGSAFPFYGDISLKKREENIRKFEEEARFLVANKDCAGYSLNLQFCNQIIFYNNDWDYGTREQAERRIYRVGQEKKCHYIDLVCDGTIEERIIKCLINKESLADLFLKDVKERQGLNLKDLLYGGKIKSKVEDMKLLGDVIDGKDL